MYSNQIYPFFFTKQFKKEKDFGGSKTVSDFVSAGGTDYGVFFDNCHHAADRMMGC